MRKIYKKMMLLLDRKQKRQMIGIVFMMLIGGILESLGISLIVPVMTVVINPGAVQSSKYLSVIYNGLHLTSTTEFAALIMLCSISFCFSDI